MRRSGVPHKMAAVLRLAAEGPVRARDLDALGVPRAYLTRLCERGVLERVERGLYRLVEADMSEWSTLADVSKRLPHAVIGLLSALQFHGMTTESPHAVWVLLDRRARRPSASMISVEVVLASGDALAHGVQTFLIDGVAVRITTPAKTVADCFRYRRHVGLDVAIEALKDYFQQRHGSIDSLVKAARADRVYARMLPYMEALASP
jgi:predicted transcriptional regulator of viral defense system